MRILNVGDFNWMSGRERDTANVDLFAIRSKLTNAAIRAGHGVVEFSDRAVARTATPLRSRRAGRKAANQAFLRLVDETQPELILLNFADDLDNASLDQARRLASSVVIVDVNIDPLPDPKNVARLARRREVVDAVFVTTAGPALQTFAPSRGFSAFMPNPVDPAVETMRAFETEAPLYDLIFPAGDDRMRQIGPVQCRPRELIERLGQRLPELRLASPGLTTPRLRGVRYFEALNRSRIGWALSRRNDQPLYASDRMAHMLGCGLLTLVDARSGFDRFYQPDEVAFYTDADDMISTLSRLHADDSLRRETAKRGWSRTWSLFEVGRVFGYMLEQLQREGGAVDHPWPCRRWHDAA